MRRTKAIAVAAASALIGAVVGGWWASPTAQMREMKAAVQIDSFQAMVNANGLPTSHYADFSMLFD